MAVISFPNTWSGVALTLRWSGRTRTLRCSRLVGVSLLVALPLLATWYLGATLYLVFHDQLLASLMTRQTDMQYAYEDRISALRTSLDRASSRGMLDHNTLETTIRDLAARGARLEARAATIDALLADPHASPRTGGEAIEAARAAELGAGRQPALPADAGAYAPAPAAGAASPSLRLDRSMDSSALQDGSRTLAELSPERIADSLARAEASQTRTVERLRDPMVRAVQRMRMALAETGLPASRWQTRDGDVGGPFEPLPAAVGGASFSQSIELLQDAARQRARLREIIDTVPLRKPVYGPLEVTSIFGARLDPFLGRPAMHTGVDLHESWGDKVAATAAGVVTAAGPEGGYGNMVEIDHGNGLSTRYAHLSSIDVVVHQRIAPGEIVGRVGSTGRSTGPHLHYETRINGEPVDPARFLKAGAGLFPG